MKVTRNCTGIKDFQGAWMIVACFRDPVHQNTVLWGTPYAAHPSLAPKLSANLRALRLTGVLEQVLGPASADMRMFPLESEEEVESFPLTKWKIPEPSEELVLSREDGVLAGDIDVVVVPGMAFDARCNRLGHGKGYYGEERELHHCSSRLQS